MFISGYSFNRFLTCILKSFWGYILSNRYARQHICAYSLLGRTWVLSTQFPLALIDNCGICGKRRFQTRAWWARQFRRITIHFIQLHPWTALFSSLAGSESAYNQEHSLCNPYLNKNEVPPWFAVQMGSVAESVAAKVRLFFELCKEFERKVRKEGYYLTVV